MLTLKLLMHSIQGGNKSESGIMSLTLQEKQN